MINIVLGDITELKNVDAIVNAANKSLLGGGGVDGAIHDKAGWKLYEECKQLNGCNTGEAKITKGYDLGIPYIIHAVGPVYYSENWSKDNNYNQADLLKNAYLNSLKIAEEYSLKRIAFSAISTGVYGYPIDEATKIALDTVIEFLKNNPDMEITFVLFTEELFDEYQAQIEKYNVEYSTEKLQTNDNFLSSIKDIKERYKSIFNNKN